jgi:hypothetical protein
VSHLVDGLAARASLWRAKKGKGSTFRIHCPIAIEASVPLTLVRGA